MAQTESWKRSSQRALPWWLPVIVLALIVARLVSSRFPVKGEKDLVRWVPAPAAGRMAEVSRKPIFYEFSAEWCGPCHVLENEVFRDAKLAGLINQGFIPVKVIDRRRETGSNPPEVAKLQGQYAVRAFPTIVVVRAGRAPVTLVGFRGRADFEEFLRGAR
jgi:thiol:disulfide interchange protein